MDWPAAQQTLEGIMRRFYPALVARAFTDAEADLGRPVPFDARGADAILGTIGARAAGITDTLRATIAGVVNEYQDDYAGAVRALQARAGVTAAKAGELARTETRFIYNQGVALAGRAAGVRHVYVSDGDGDAECAALDGTTQTVEWAQAHPISHPNCRRVLSLIEESG